MIEIFRGTDKGGWSHVHRLTIRFLTWPLRMVECPGCRMGREGYMWRISNQGGDPPWWGWLILIAFLAIVIDPFLILEIDKFFR